MTGARAQPPRSGSAPRSARVKKIPEGGAFIGVERGKDLVLDLGLHVGGVLKDLPAAVGHEHAVATAIL